MLVRLACQAVPGLGEVVTVKLQPDDGEVLTLLSCLAPGGGFAPAGRAGQGGSRSSVAGGGVGPDPLAAGIPQRVELGVVALGAGGTPPDADPES